MSWNEVSRDAQHVTYRCSHCRKMAVTGLWSCAVSPCCCLGSQAEQTKPVKPATGPDPDPNGSPHPRSGIYP